MMQLSLLDVSTNIDDHLAEMQHEFVTVSKRMSKSINSKGFSIILYKNKKLCYAKIDKIDNFYRLQMRDSDDWQGFAIPCSSTDVFDLLSEGIGIYLKYGDKNGRCPRIKNN